MIIYACSKSLMLYTLTLYNVMCQFYLNKTGKNKLQNTKTKETKIQNKTKRGLKFFSTSYPL